MKNSLFALIFLIISSALFAQDDINLLDLVKSQPADSVRVIETPASESVTSQPLPLEYDWRNHRHSLLVSYGTPSVLATSVAGFVWILNLGNDKYPLFVGPVSVEYDYNVLKWLRVGGRLSYMYVRDKSRYGSGDNHVLGATARLDFTYLNRRKIKLYSGLELGVGGNVMETSKTKNDDENKGFPVFFGNLCVFGLQAGGDHVYFMSEIGVGTIESFRLGIGVHF